MYILVDLFRDDHKYVLNITPVLIHHGQNEAQGVLGKVPLLLAQDVPIIIPESYEKALD